MVRLENAGRVVLFALKVQPLKLQPTKAGRGGGVKRCSIWDGSAINCVVSEPDIIARILISKRALPKTGLD
jgi:hypothetical protein